MYLHGSAVLCRGYFTHLCAVQHSARVCAHLLRKRPHVKAITSIKSRKTALRARKLKLRAGELHVFSMEAAPQANVEAQVDLFATVCSAILIVAAGYVFYNMGSVSCLDTETAFLLL